MGNVAVYKKGTTDFFSQGLGLLSDVVSSNLTQTVSSTGNVEQKLEVEYPIDGYLVSELVEGAILRVSVSTNKSDYGVFEIVDTLKDDSGTITVYGDPYYNRILRMSFDNGGVFTKFSSVQSALNAAKQNITGFPADFNLTSNLNTSVDLSENTYDTFGTFLEALNSAVHGNIKYSLNSIQIYSAIGKDITDITLRDDMNTSSVKITTDFSGIINKVIPVLPVLDKDGNATDQTKVGTIVTSKYSNQFLDYWAGKVIKFDTQDLANTYFDRTKADRPVHTVDVNPIGLDDDFSTINIFDTIELYSTRLDYTDKLRVSERVFDTLAENVTSFKLGSSSVNIFNQINEQNNEIFNNVVKMTNAAISANGKGIDYFGQAKPSSPKEGNTWFWDDGTDFGIKQYTNGEWVDLAGSNTAEKIAASVTEAVTQAKAHTDEVKQVLSSDIATAKSRAASQASTAEANAKSEATSLFSQAQNALSDAKKDLTKSIASEASERTQAVAAANSQAQAYVNQAKSDINDTINALSVGGRNLLLNSKLLSWGVANNAATTSAEVSYDSTTNMWHITSPKGGSENAGIYFFQPGNVSNIITKGQQWAFSIDIKGTGVYSQFGVEWSEPFNRPSGNVPTDWTRVSSTGTATGTNAIIIYFNSKDVALDVYIKLPKLETGTIPTDWTPAPEDVVLDYTTKDNKIKETITQYQETTNGTVSRLQTDVTKALGQVATKVSQTDYDKKTGDLSTKYTQVKQTVDSQATDIVDIKKTATSQASKINSISSDVDGTKQSISDIKKTQDSQSDKVNQITNDVNGTKQSITDIQTKDGKQDARMGTIETSVSGVKSDFSSYKTTNDGVVKTAQTTAQTAVDGLKTKISQTDYNQKTGEISRNANEAKDTADKALRTIGDYKTNNDKRVHEAESSIERTANSITEKVSITDYDKKTGELSHDLSELKHTAEGFEETVTKVKNLAVGGRNLLLGTRDWAGDSTRWEKRGTVTKDTYRGMVIAATTWPWNSPRYQTQHANILQVGKTYTFSTYVRNTSDTDTHVAPYCDNEIVTPIGTTTSLPAHTDWVRVSITFKCVKDSTTSAGTLRWEGIYGVKNGQIQFAGYKLEEGTIATDWSPAPEDVQSDIAQVKITADGINNFVRDSSGNISSDFQTALSKTSIITGSTLATSIQKQTSSQISSAITDNNGKIISLINQDSSGVQIAGKNIVLNGDTTVTGDFYAKGGNFKNLNASNLTVGTLNGNQVNITNINANNIVSGAISGANLNINLNTGSVVFQKGRINSSDYTTDINIDQGYISTANDNTRALIKQGMIQLVAPNRFDLESSPYMEISNNRGQRTAGAAIIGRDSVSIANSKNAKNIFPAPIGTETFSGLYTGQAFDGGWLPTKVAGADRGVVVAGGTETTWQVVNSSPYIRVGTDAGGSYSYGNRVVIQAEFLHATAVYYHSGSGGANVYVASDGALVKSSSATKYKTNIEHETDSIQGDQLLTIDPATWNDKFEAEQLERYHETGVEPERQINMEGKRYYGIVAEDLVKAGLEELVTRNEETDEVEGVEYSKIGVALIPIVRDLRNRLNEQYVEIERLKDKIK
ncbi:gp58-like family protein [Leuconostoc mesenteroides]|uniref:gp58-like family protein n=1 Tax=Leuconostoc mesenteroides TaxID=1245 RepID=UPI00235F6A31|nr:gp58-like family protein [Leuconostoc mesenteroides]